MSRRLQTVNRTSSVSKPRALIPSRSGSTQKRFPLLLTDLGSAPSLFLLERGSLLLDPPGLPTQRQAYEISLISY